MIRVFVLSGLIALGASSMAWSQASQQAPPAPDPSNFTGKVTSQPISDFRTLRLMFEPGARTNWHSHAGGQVIIVEKGTLRVQERGGSGKELTPNQTYYAAPNVVHWHGALPSGPLTQVTISYGMTNWLDKVSDSQYQSAARK
jgi:quercetin dioxygenase-like cupin family protein